MPMNKAKKLIEEILHKVDIQIQGSRPWDIQVLNENFYERVFKYGSLGLGESYMDNWWDCANVDQFIYKILRADIKKNIPLNFDTIWAYIITSFINQQTKSKSRKVIDVHYDLGNDLYERMLDKRMVYTCGYWSDADNLDLAQEKKLDLVCKKLQLKPGMRVLDIGCGFGSFLKFAAERYGISGVGITLSKEQKILADKLCAGLPIEIRIQDYRDINEKFDAVASIGMFEAVGYKNFDTFMKVVHNCLPEEGLFLLHTIGSNAPKFDFNNIWVDKYIFPNGALPTISSIGRSVGNRFIMEDWHNFGSDYSKTLCAWFENFDNKWLELSEKYGDRFYRMWKFYLLSFAGAFRARHIQLWQIVLSKKGVLGGYKSVR